MILMFEKDIHNIKLDISIFSGRYLIQFPHNCNDYFSFSTTIRKKCEVTKGNTMPLSNI